MHIIYIKTRVGWILFLIQYASLAFLILSGSLYPHEWYYWLPYLGGWILGIWAILAMGPGNLNAGPDVMPSGRLVKSGPYRLIRHPMYLAILLVFTPLVGTTFTHMRFAVIFILSINLVLKIRYEERRLKTSFKQYSEYSAGTWRLLPYVY
jgi:protein-S-isoprenylcysteine O-methyltransferase Ste14